MCGIAGILDFSGQPVDFRDLVHMTLTLKHRGPDDQGFYLVQGPGPAVGLGHRRLSIIDLSPQGRQPLSNEDGTIWVTFNGEIYNYRELRQDLQHRGHRFQSGTDTEVLVHAYEEWGPSCLNRLEGMFAFALWDGYQKRLWAARDRMGKKPFYFWQQGPLFLFASEPKALLAHPRVTPELDLCSLSRYLLFEYVPAPDTIFAGMQKLRPGYFLLADAKGVHFEPYWKLGDYLADHANGQPEEEVIVALRLRLRQAVEKRLIADVPIGVFLSGGLDSSTIVALLASQSVPGPLKTFSLGFTDPSFDESYYARTVAHYFGTEHHEEIFSAGQILDLINKIIEYLDEPLADAAIIPTYLLAAFTSLQVKVVLAGEGGDELFAGYPTFLAEKLASSATRLPPLLWRYALTPLIQRLPVSLNNLSLDFCLKQFVKGLPYPPPIRGLIWLAAFAWEEQRSVLSPEVQAGFNGFNLYQEIQERLAGPRFSTPLDLALYTYSQYYLPEDLLVKVDRASMAHGLEVRTPFLDRELVEYVSRLPAHLKLRGLTSKYIFRRAMAPLVPKIIRQRPKKGFGIPLSRWFKGALRPFLMDMLGSQPFQESGLFHVPTVKRLLNEHFNGVRDNRKPLWTLLIFELWRQHYMGGRGRKGAANP